MGFPHAEPTVEVDPVATSGRRRTTEQAPPRCAGSVDATGEGAQSRECGLLGGVAGDVGVETGVSEMRRWGEVCQDVLDIEVRSAIDETFRRRHGWSLLGASALSSASDRRPSGVHPNQVTPSCRRC